MRYVLPFLLCIAASAHAQTPFPKNGKYLPPVEFDRPYTDGPIYITVGKDQTEVRRLCPYTNFGPWPAIACNQLQGKNCVIAMAAYPVIQATGIDPGLVLRHEIAHCNGWGADHKGAR